MQKQGNKSVPVDISRPKNKEPFEIEFEKSIYTLRLVLLF